MNIKIDTFLEDLFNKFKCNPVQAKKVINDYLDRIYKTQNKTEQAWLEGGKCLFMGAVLFLLDKQKPFTFDDLKELLLLNQICENRQELLIEKFKDAPGFIQECFAGILDNASATFKSYVGVLKNLILRIEKQ